jgi:hypothetical protein
VLRLLYPGDSTATVDLLDATQSEVNKKVKRLNVRIHVAAKGSGKLDFAAL